MTKIMTKIFDMKDFGQTVSSERQEEINRSIRECAEILKNGGTVAFPTETVYGLGANAMDPDAVAKIFEAKGRPSDNPIIVHIARASDIEQLVTSFDEDTIKLIDSFWPGPLTIVLPKSDIVPEIVTAGLDTVAVRMPEEAIALELIEMAETPLAAPSANVSGKPSPTMGAHVLADLEGKVDAIITGGNSRVGIESTVIDMTGKVPTILRPGIVTKEELELVLEKKVEIDPGVMKGTTEAPKSPGMKYTHYAPNAQMTVFEGNRAAVEREIERVKQINERLGNKVGIVMFGEEEFDKAANEFFARLRELDNEGVDLILAGALSERNSVGFAVMNRMLKSAGYHIVYVNK